MIIGIGTDVCEVERIANAIERRGQAFLDRLFSVAEQQAAGHRRDPASFYAGRFAAKEACAKALGTGITDRIRWTDIETLATRSRQPKITLAGGAARRLSQLAGKGRAGRVQVSISHDGAYALAFVLLEDGPPLQR